MPDLRLNQNLRLTQTQKLALTQKIRQALEILQVPSMDLDNLIRKELQDNPLLEQQGSDFRGDEDRRESDDTGNGDESWDEEPSRSDTREDDTLDILRKLDEHSGDSYTGTYRTDEDTWFPEPPSEPTLYEYLKEYEKTDRVNWKRLKMIACGADTLHESTISGWERRTGAKILEGYGMTETTAVSHSTPYDRPKSGSFGVPIPGVTAAIVDIDGETVGYEL